MLQKTRRRFRRRAVQLSLTDYAGDERIVTGLKGQSKTNLEIPITGRHEWNAKKPADVSADGPER